MLILSHNHFAVLFEDTLCWKGTGFGHFAFWGMRASAHFLRVSSRLYPSNPMTQPTIGHKRVCLVLYGQPDLPAEHIRLAKLFVSPIIEL